MARRHLLTCVAVSLLLVIAAASAEDEPLRIRGAELAGPEVYTATAVVSPEKGKEKTTPVTITITRLTTEDERAKVADIMKSEGAAGLRKLLPGLPEAGSIEFGGESHTLRFAAARSLGGGTTLYTLGCDHPLVFIGADGKRAEPKEGYDFALLDLTIDGTGAGEGSVAAAAKLKVGPEGGLVVDDFGGNKLRLRDVKKQAK